MVLYFALKLLIVCSIAHKLIKLEPAQLKLLFIYVLAITFIQYMIIIFINFSLISLGSQTNVLTNSHSCNFNQPFLIPILSHLDNSLTFSIHSINYNSFVQNSIHQENSLTGCQCWGITHIQNNNKLNLKVANLLVVLHKKI